MDRRSLIKLLAVTAGSLWTLRLPASESDENTPSSDSGEPVSEPGQPFSFEWLKGQARYLAQQPYAAPDDTLPAEIDDLTWDEYQAIRFRPDRAIWADEDLPFQIQLFHLGLYFREPVRIHQVVEGRALGIEYAPTMFTHEGDLSLADLPSDLGFAGFRIHFHTNFKLDLAAFLGASYFRAIGQAMQFGLSARGLAVNTAAPEGEEFPRFTAFWFERPKSDAHQLRVWALLDSPSVTGAYAFILKPGALFTMEVEAILHPRKELERVGIAPLTSMYQVGENSRRMGYDWRSEIHDSDGLLLHTGAGQWIWRPLSNPARLQYNSFLDRDPKGFGLFQRDRAFENYQDDGVFYDRRPSLWIEPRNGWGQGRVDLVEIPTVDETFDNIVAYWNPDQRLVPNKEYRFAYRMSWGEVAPGARSGLARVVATRTGLGGVVGQPRKYFSWRFVVDFADGMLPMLAEGAEVVPVIKASRGRVEITSARPLASIRGYRAMFDLVPDESETPIDLSMVLKLGTQILTETWVYQYIPPPPDDRKLL